MPELHDTLMGRKLIQHDLPEIARQLERIANSLDKILSEKENKISNIDYLKSIRVTDFDLSTRLSNVLKELNIRTIYDLVTKKEEDFKTIKNRFGQKSMLELKDILNHFGIYSLYWTDENINNATIKFPNFPI
jgi:DNA-directed RNA polymerase alpha subunit